MQRELKTTVKLLKSEKHNTYYMAVRVPMETEAWHWIIICENEAKEARNQLNIKILDLNTEIEIPF